MALKVLTGQLALDREMRQRFVNEARVAASDQSQPRIIAIHNLIVVDGDLAIAMELVDGRNLAAIVEEQGPLPERVALEYILRARRLRSLIPTEVRGAAA